MCLCCGLATGEVRRTGGDGRTQGQDDIRPHHDPTQEEVTSTVSHSICLSVADLAVSHAIRLCVSG